MPTPNVRSDVWNHVEAYTILMLLACRLKIIPTSNLKLIISFLVLLILLLASKSCYHLLPQLGTLHLTSRIYLRLANRPSAQFCNSSKQERPPSSRRILKHWGPVLPYFKSSKSINPPSLCWAYLEEEMLLFFFHDLLNVRSKTIPTNELCTRTNFQRFLNEVPGSSFKKLITSTPLLLRGLRTMSLTKSVPDRLKP
jgi:hypothetical protein